MMAARDLREGLSPGAVPKMGDAYWDDKTASIKIVVPCSICKTPISVLWLGMVLRPKGACMACARNLRR